MKKHDFEKPFWSSCIQESLLIRDISLAPGYVREREWWGYPCMLLLIPSAIIDIAVVPAFILWFATHRDEFGN